MNNLQKAHILALLVIILVYHVFTAYTIYNDLHHGFYGVVTTQGNSLIEVKFDKTGKTEWVNCNDCSNFSVGQRVTSPIQAGNLFVGYSPSLNAGSDISLLRMTIYFMTNALMAVIAAVFVIAFGMAYWEMIGKKN